MLVKGVPGVCYYQPKMLSYHFHQNNDVKHSQY